MAKVEVTRTTALFPSKVFIQWDLETDESGAHLVDVYRAGSPDGPWQQLASSLVNAYHYVDEHLNLPPPEKPTDVHEGLNFFSLSRDVYYRVIVTPPSGSANAFQSEPTLVEPTLDTRTRLLKRKILRDESIAFKALNGVPIAVLKRRHWGTRCRDCYDEQLREGLKEHCRACFGTTFEGGYWSPVVVRGRRTPAPVQEQMTAHGDSEVRRVNFILLDYPSVRPKDLLVDLRKNERYLVEIVSPTELKGVVVHQTITASHLSRNSVEYEVLVDQVATPPLY